MEGFLKAMPSTNQGNFSQLGRARSNRLSHSLPLYIPLHDTDPPPDQVIKPQQRDVLLDFFYKNRPKSVVEIQEAEQDIKEPTKKRENSQVMDEHDIKKLRK
eukprot:m.71984 g.71984  ORF g.71984 m.71984 type:complete len:102 (-) comp12294_c0_seq1:710-1015(-)